MASSVGRLVLVATPIGNLGDLSDRARLALSEAEMWLVEDTRVSGKLQSALGIPRPMRTVNEHTPDERLTALVDEIRAGRIAVLLTDAGAPGVSDPGARLVDLCHQAAVPVDSVPGPSAVTNALALSGFYAQRFAFLGFLGRKPGAIRDVLAPFAESPLTLVLFESPHRFGKLLAAAHGVLGPRRYAICREMTKLHQQVFRGQLPEVPNASAVPARGEFTLVIEGLRRGKERDLEGSVNVEGD